MVDVQTAEEHLRVLGVDPVEPPKDISIVEINAPVSGVITDQKVTNAAAVRSLDAGPTCFTISDLSHVWIVCDVYENDLPNVRIGDSAEVRLNAYPDQMLHGHASAISARCSIPTSGRPRSASKCRIPGIHASGHVCDRRPSAARRWRRTPSVPAAAVLHMHDRDWVYVPAPATAFAGSKSSSGDALPDNMQEDQVRPDGRASRWSSNALVLDHAIEQ